MPRVSVRELLSRSPSDVILLDGGMGSSMEDRGVDVRTDLWSSVAQLTSAGRGVTSQLHADFIAAGADIVIADTHNVHPDTCRRFLDGRELGGFEIPPSVLEGDESERAERFLGWLERGGVEITRDAIPEERDVVVAAGIGSEEPWATETSRTELEIEASLEPCMRALREMEGTFILFETVSTAPEIAAVANLVRREGLRDFGVGLSCGPDGRTWGGVSMSEVVEQFDGTSVAALFVQCTRYDVASTGLVSLLEALRGPGELDAVPGVYANDGRTWKDRRWHGERVSPQAYADAAEAWRAAGARIIGGCCGTTPDHIAELRRRWR